MANLAFDINSFHYRYYMFIRYMWGYTDKPQRTSLCPYCQTMFWGSIFVVVFSWALVFGWICMKLGRMTCKLQNPYTDALIRYLDEKTKWMDALDSGPTAFAESPMWTALHFCMIGVLSVLIVVMAVAIVGTAFGIIGLGLWNIGDVGAAILYGVAWVFSQFFMGLYWVGFAWDWICTKIVWLFTNGELWYDVLSWAVYIIVWVLGMGVAAVVLCLSFIGISKLPPSRRFGKFLTNKFNGYSEAQEQRRARVRKTPWKCEYCKYNNGNSEDLFCQECGSAKPKPINLNPFLYLFYPLAWVIVWVVDRGCIVKDKIRNREIDIIGPLGILWSYLVAIKKGVCPIVEFVDSEQLQAAAQASAKDRMERENEPTESPSQTDD